MHIHARHHLFFMGKHKLWGKHLGIWDIDPKYVQPTKREIIILDRNQYSIWGNICTARCHKTCYSTFLMLESATSGSGTHQRLCLHSILQADWSSIWLHSKPVRNHVVTLACAKPQRINPNEKINVCENSDTSDQVCTSLQKWPVDIAGSGFQETSVGF